jgi:hypothetical protein
MADAENFDVVVEVVETYREVIEITGAWNIYYIDSSGGVNTYVHAQDTAALTWNVLHALGGTDLSITVYDQNKLRHHPASIDFLNDSNILINFTTAVAGRAIIIKA